MTIILHLWLAAITVLIFMAAFITTVVKLTYDAIKRIPTDEGEMAEKIAEQLEIISEEKARRKKIEEEKKQAEERRQARLRKLEEKAEENERMQQTIKEI